MRESALDALCELDAFDQEVLVARLGLDGLPPRSPSEIAAITRRPEGEVVEAEWRGRSRVLSAAFGWEG